MELYENPSSVFVAGFIGSPKMNFLTGIPAEKLKAKTIGVRPEHSSSRMAKPMSRERSTTPKFWAATVSSM